MSKSEFLHGCNCGGSVSGFSGLQRPEKPTKLEVPGHGTASFSQKLNAADTLPKKVAVVLQKVKSVLTAK